MATAKTVGPNSGTRKQKARKAGKCQSCGEKTTGFSVIVDPPGVGDVSKVKAREGKSFWCNDCAKGKVALYETAIERKVKANKGKAKAKPAAAKKAAAKKPAARKGQRKAAPKKAAVKKPAAKRTGRKAKAAAAAEPF